MKNIKKGFTLVELLFVMAIIAILAGFAIANLKDSTKVATENSMKNDLKNFISAQHTAFAANGEYPDVCNVFANEQGTTTCSDQSGHTIMITLSKENRIANVYSQTCEDGGLGFYISIGNNNLNKSIGFDSCSDGTIGNFEDYAPLR